MALLTGEMSKLRAWPKRQREELLAAVATIRTLATIDELTSLVNRRHMNEVLGAEERREHWRGQPVCIALLDIDFFKSVNDRYGHAGGDAVLRNFAGAARADLRAGDVLARWGGEEFLLMLPDTAGRSDAGARPDGRADQRHAHRRTRWRQRHHVFGRAGRTRQSRAVRRNDRARRPCAVCLYVAKSSARNRVVVVGEVPSP
ncbi:MAG: diguanylate cyclase [Massilia sp.]|nr:diguanylate cyclase [Massilia sp.]